MPGVATTGMKPLTHYSMPISCKLFVRWVLCGMFLGLGGSPDMHVQAIVELSRALSLFRPLQPLGNEVMPLLPGVRMCMLGILLSRTHALK